MSMRGVGNADEFTPLGLFMREHCRSSDIGLSIINIDYMVLDFRNNRLMIIEEKRRGAGLHIGQGLALQFLDDLISAGAPLQSVEYWGWYVLQFPEGKHFPGPGMRLNNVPITVEELVAHVNFERMHVPGLTKDTMRQLTMGLTTNGGRR